MIRNTKDKAVVTNTQQGFNALLENVNKVLTIHFKTKNSATAIL